jgi:hypothetical protein
LGSQAGCSIDNPKPAGRIVINRGRDDLAGMVGGIVAIQQRCKWRILRIVCGEQQLAERYKLASSHMPPIAEGYGKRLGA